MLERKKSGVSKKVTAVGLEPPRGRMLELEPDALDDWATEPNGSEIFRSVWWKEKIQVWSYRVVRQGLAP